MHNKIQSVKVVTEMITVYFLRQSYEYVHMHEHVCLRAGVPVYIYILFFLM
jgi:hypothetical protein